MSSRVEELVPSRVPAEFRQTYCEILRVALQYGVLLDRGTWDLVQPGHYVVILSGAGYHVQRGRVTSWGLPGTATTFCR